MPTDTKKLTKAEKLALARLTQVPGVALTSKVGKKRLAKRAERMRELAAMGTEDAFRHATALALAAHLAKQQELGGVPKMTRTDGSKLRKAIHAGVQAGVYVGERIGRQMDIPDQLLMAAVGMPDALEQELKLQEGREPHRVADVRYRAMRMLAAIRRAENQAAADVHVATTGESNG